MKISAVLLLFFSISLANAQNFISREIVIQSDGGSSVGICNLGATYLSPSKDSPKALIIFVHGSGTSNRDEEEAAGYHPFKDIAEKLSQNGFATLRFDKRGMQPECRPALINNQNLSPWNYIQDIQNIINFSQNDSEMNKLPIILLGHSEGVNFITELAAKNIPNLKGMILLAGLAKYSIAETILRQWQQVLQTPSIQEPVKTAVQKLLNDGEIFFGKIQDGSIQSSDSYMSVYSKYWSEWIAITKDGERTAQKLNIPALVVRGTLDTNVTEEDFNVLVAATQDIPGSSSFAPIGLNHLFTESDATNVSSAVLDKITDWLLSIKI